MVDTRESVGFLLGVKPRGIRLAFLMKRWSVSVALKHQRSLAPHRHPPPTRHTTRAGVGRPQTHTHPPPPGGIEPRPPHTSTMPTSGGPPDTPSIAGHHARPPTPTETPHPTPHDPPDCGATADPTQRRDTATYATHPIGVIVPPACARRPGPPNRAVSPEFEVVKRSQATSLPTKHLYRARVHPDAPTHVTGTEYRRGTRGLCPSGCRPCGDLRRTCRRGGGRTTTGSRFRWRLRLQCSLRT